MNQPTHWRRILEQKNGWPHLLQALACVQQQRESGKTIFPPQHQLFAALQHTPLPSVRVVIVGQDPYHGPGQACGLSFSVSPQTKIPPSLRNIYQELQQDLGITNTHGNLIQWAQQGVLLLNAILSVEEGHPLSHANIGWEPFTRDVLEACIEDPNPKVFMLWGRFAKEKIEQVAHVPRGTSAHLGPHLILTAPHPSPFSCHRGFFGCRHFSQANTFLAQHDRGTIDWKVE